MPPPREEHQAGQARSSAKTKGQNLTVTPSPGVEKADGNPLAFVHTVKQFRTLVSRARSASTGNLERPPASAEELLQQRVCELERRNAELLARTEVLERQNSELQENARCAAIRGIAGELQDNTSAADVAEADDSSRDKVTGPPSSTACRVRGGPKPKARGTVDWSSPQAKGEPAEFEFARSVQHWQKLVSYARSRSVGPENLQQTPVEEMLQNRVWVLEKRNSELVSQTDALERQIAELQARCAEVNGIARELQELQALAKLLHPR